MAREIGVPTSPYRDPTGSLEGSRDTDEGIVVSTEPDICLTPSGGTMVPVGYNIWAKQADDARTTPTVKLTSLRSHNMASLITTCHGDEAGTGGGVKSGTHNGICEPKGHSSNVYSEGKQMIRHTDEWWMNNRNTVGKLIYVKDAGAYGRWFEAQARKVQVAQAAPTTKSDIPTPVLGLMGPAGVAADSGPAAAGLGGSSAIVGGSAIPAGEIAGGSLVAGGALAGGLVAGSLGLGYLVQRDIEANPESYAQVVNPDFPEQYIYAQSILAKRKAEAEAKLKEIKQQQQTESVVRVTGSPKSRTKSATRPASANEIAAAHGPLRIA